MKTSQDPRHQKRIRRMQHLFTMSYQPSARMTDIADIIPHLTTVDERIQKSAPEWPLDKIAKIDLAVLRLAVWELAVNKTQPPKVIIDEAIELAKSFGNPNSPKFVNGVLGTILKSV